ncbi:uncharacterized protein BYT42DRAFT_414053 [Radiomyces spectabilis]|uniref:uncharacterized protein n=1 Tax=Radiomyces spectabilis TaxID=64574 RepID=UPI00221F5CA3|nr:uncharacterized protein BYT42DRAFT_414053 [Radiomyces spectabilis]KAI8374633.1 hypothetical protein BYT42DRAFT_414053 [Radiomyces spectabilis]
MGDRTAPICDESTVATVRLPRRQFRSQCKKARRRQRRQKEAEARDRQAPLPTEEEKRHQQEQALADQLEYERQKALWEERERQHNLINTARRKALETEQKAKELAKQKWQAALLSMPMIPSSSFPIERKVERKKTSNMKKFIGSEPLGGTNLPIPRKRYKDRLKDTRSSSNRLDHDPNNDGDTLTH